MGWSHINDNKSCGGVISTTTNLGVELFIFTKTNLGVEAKYIVGIREDALFRGLSAYIEAFPVSPPLSIETAEEMDIFFV